MDSKTYSLHNKKIIHESMEDEILIVNLSNGHYYNLSNAGGVIWKALLLDFTPIEILDNLLQSIPGNREKLQKDINAFIQELLSEKLIAVGDGSETKPSTFPKSNLIEPYIAPKLEIFTDIEELLLLDPIHEVDDSGWPASLSSEDELE
jgi:hypothetical protein